jgi:alanyl-tRNA synthetase
MASRPTSETSSRSSASSGKSAEEVRAHSAVHVLKGAVTKVVGPRHVTFGEEGVLKFRSEAPVSAQDLGKIGAAANRKIAEDEEILEFSMDRQEAEGHFGTGIYDLSQAPEGAALLSVVRIPDWDASHCPRAHVDTTGSIGAIRMDGASFDERAKEVVLRFHLL